MTLNLLAAATMPHPTYLHTATPLTTTYCDLLTTSRYDAAAPRLGLADLQDFVTCEARAKS